jgi:hypothetical protein
MKLPGGDGGDVFRLVRGGGPGGPDGPDHRPPRRDDPLVERVLAEGADAACYKPFDVPPAPGDALPNGQGTGVTTRWTPSKPLRILVIEDDPDAQG